MTTVFVYGTLKRGGTNHSFLTGQNYLGRAQSAPGYTLVSLGEYPGMIVAVDDKVGVSGELWNVDANCLAQLDQLEGIDEGLYQRVKISLLPPSSTAIAEAYLYARPHTGLPWLGSDWPLG